MTPQPSPSPVGGDVRRFYVGVKPCGCVSALLVDDEHTTPEEIADFAKRMAKTKRRMEHRTTVTRDDVSAVFALCQCDAALQSVAGAP